MLSILIAKISTPSACCMGCCRRSDCCRSTLTRSTRTRASIALWWTTPSRGWILVRWRPSSCGTTSTSTGGRVGPSGYVRLRFHLVFCFCLSLLLALNHVFVCRQACVRTNLEALDAREHLDADTSFGAFYQNALTNRRKLLDLVVGRNSSCSNETAARQVGKREYFRRTVRVRTQLTNLLPALVSTRVGWKCGTTARGRRRCFTYHQSR